jgi:hypothetical protein
MIHNPSSIPHRSEKSTVTKSFDLDAICADRFSHGDPRSPEYKAGFCYGLNRMCLSVEERRAFPICVPYPKGTAAWDAWFSGFDHGKDVYRSLEDSL